MLDRRMFLREAFLIISLACFSGLGAGQILAGEIIENGKKIYSYGNEELVIRDFFNDRKNGIFLDVGAFHYSLVSSTYYLEDRLGWSGIAVDALAEFALGYIQHRPRTRFFNFLVSDHSWEVEPFFRVPGPHTGLSTTSKAWLDMFYKRLPGAREWIDKKQEIHVMTITLTDLLDKNGITKLDLLTMNIEGSEMKALAGFDIERFRPELATLECIGNKKRILAYFTAHGYELVTKYKKYDRKNCYFKPKKWISWL